jgi:cysteinyl-tRNA synthetase, unknown class
MRRNRRLLAIVLTVSACVLLAGAAPGAGTGAAASHGAAARAKTFSAAPSATTTITPSPLLEGFAAPDPTLSVSSDNDSFVNGRPDVAVKRVSYVPGELGDCMRVDFFMRGGLWKNVMVEVNKSVPLNLSGQDTLKFTMKGDWADRGGAQSVTVALTMLNGALYYQSLSVTKKWHTYEMALDASGSAWGTDGPNWGARDVFTLDKIATVTFFVSPPRTGDYSLYFDDLAVEGGPVQPYVNVDAPVAEKFISIPYAIGQAVDDMGWRDWDNRRKSVRDYQVLLKEKASLADYQTVVDIGKAAGTRLTTVWIMQDFDRKNAAAKAKYNTPVAQYDMTSDGTSWTNSITPDQHGIIGLVKGNAEFMEFGMHGVSHEHFRKGVEKRAEYAHIDESKPGRATTWGWADMNLKARCYRELLRQYFTPQQLDMPVAEVPPAHAYYYSKTDPRTTGALLHRYGVKYVNGGINISTSVRDGYLIDRGVLFINRAYGTNWDWVGSTPWEGFWNDFDAPYYPSDKYGWVEAHFPNLWGAKQKWVDYLLGINDSQNRFLPKNSAQCSWQYLYHKFGTITEDGGTYTIDLTKMDPAAYKWDLLGSMVLKTWVGDREISSVALTNGASVLGTWKDTFGYAYIVLGVNGNPQGRLDRAVYQMTVAFGDQPMPSCVDLSGATYNVQAFSAGAHEASLKLEMFGRQTVRVRLPFAPASVESDHPGLEVRSWSYADGILTADVRGTRLTGEVGTITVRDTASAQPAWSAVDDFLYQLQNLDLVKAGNSRFDLVITDYAENGHEATRFTPGQIAALQHSPGGPKRVLAYMSIGEAETYRWYWQKAWDANGDGIPDPGAPSWLGRSNPDWLDNYKVRFWDPDWQKIIYGTPDSYLDKIIADGYDGVYLDIIDAYEYWGPGGQVKPMRATAAQDMVDFVRRLAEYARVVKGRPDFAVFPQNGAELGKHPEYMAVVTGLGQEDTWYNGDAVSPWTAGTVPALERFQRAGKLVLCTDYCRRPAHIERFYRKAQAHGFVPYATVRDLDRMVVNPGHAPD